MENKHYIYIVKNIKNNIDDKINKWYDYFYPPSISMEPINFDETCVYIQGKQRNYPPIKEFNIEQFYKLFLKKRNKIEI